MKRKETIIVWILISMLFLAVFACAEHLPIRTYTIDDGLANDGVNKIVRDSRGFLWFCTGEGLSRFDGFSFKNYTQNEGLPHRNINDLLETKGGDLLVATNSGLAVFDPDGRAYRWDFLRSILTKTSNEKPLFQTYVPPNTETEKKARSILSLTESVDGKVFAGTGKGLFRIEKEGDERIFRKVESGEWPEDTEFSVLKFDRANYLWIVATSGIYRMSPNGEIQNFKQDGGGSLLVDNKGKVWVGGSGTDSGLRVFTVSADGRSAKLTTTYRKSDGLPEENSMLDIFQISTGRIFVLVARHLSEFLPNARPNEAKFRTIEDGAFETVAEDNGGNLWLGTTQEGASKISLGGFVQFDRRDDVALEHISSLRTDSNGNIFITEGDQTLSLFENGRFETVKPLSLKKRSWANGLIDFQDASGDWWIPALEGLLHYSKTKEITDLAKNSPKRIYNEADGLYGDNVFNLFEDSHKNIWISSSGKAQTLQYLDHKTGLIWKFAEDSGLPTSNSVVAFGEDRSGSIWLGFYYGGLARFKDGKFQFFTGNDGIPLGSISSIFVDSAKRIWIATASRGVFRVDDPAAETPVFTNISTNEGLTSNQTNCIAEDNLGHIYIGTGRGINRLDPRSGLIKSFTQADGLPTSVVQYCQRDSSGALWFASEKSLVKFIPQKENPLKPPPIFISGVNVNGVDQKISELGTQSVEDLQLDSDQRQIRIDFFALGFNSGDRLRYQYKMGDEDWHSPDDLRSLNFNLASGEYKFFVRAVNADNVASEKPAMFSFSIAYPFWQRWWFLLLLLLFAAAAVLVIERTRVARLQRLKSAFGQLSVSENRFRQMIEQSPLGTVIFAPDGSIRVVNRAYENFWGIRFEQIKDWDFLADEQIIKTGVAEKLRRVFTGETAVFPPTEYDPQANSAGVEVNKKAAVRWIQSFAYPVKNDAGELLEVILVMEDITDRRRADEIEQNAKSERLRELEHVRHRIAADLHDDIGSSLTQISIWSEVLKRNIAGQENETVAQPLMLIGNTSRELVDAMSDIVWAINPDKDFFSELSGKMRRFAADIFTARRIEFAFNASPFDKEFALGANLRREVFLIFKEAVTNIIKHSECTIVSIELRIESSQIFLTLKDNGIGFDVSENKFGGHGLWSMKNRAKGLGGSLEIVSNDPTGTSIIFSAPLGSDQE